MAHILMSFGDPGELFLILRVLEAGLKFDEYHVGSGGPTRAEFNMKPAVDVTGNLTITKTPNAVTVINTFVAQYVGDLRWDFILIGRECKTSRWGPKEWGFEDVEEFTEGICGLIPSHPILRASRRKKSSE